MNHARVGNQAATLLQAGRAEQALTLLDEALRRDARIVELLDLRGDALEALGRVDAAMQSWRRALVVAPGHIPSLCSLAAALVATGDPGAAVPLLRRATAAVEGPKAAPIWHNLAGALVGAGQPEAALQAAGHAHRLDPDHNDITAALVIHLAGAGQLAEAENLLADAAPGGATAAAAFDLGQRAWAAQNHPAAERLLRQAVRHNPDDAEAQHDLGLCLLSMGRLQEGFAALEWRARARAESQRAVGPRWSGAATPEQLMLVHFEQGLGDFIQFCRFLPIAAHRIRVAVEVPASLERLAASIQGVERVIRRDQGMRGFNVQLPLMSLPLVLGTTMQTIPPPPYLAPPPGRMLAWRQRLAGLSGRRVGLAWAGNPAFPADHLRSIPPPLLELFGDLENHSFVSLQTGGGPRPALPLHDWTSELVDLAETAALIAALDLVISVDTAVAHLAAALGRPVWLLNRYDTDWRWRHVDTNGGNLWYPTLREFRQTVPGDWSLVLKQTAEALRYF